MRRSLVGVVGALVLGTVVAAVSSCGDNPVCATAACATPGDTTTNPTGTDLFDAAADPVNVSTTPDGSHAASKVIGRDGGTVTATGGDGSQYTLDIPEDALPDTMTITLTPLSSVSGLPFAGGLVAGVQMGPDGLGLGQDATLTITPAKSVAIGNQTFLGYNGTGSDLHLAMPAGLDSTIQILVQHFSGSLLSSGTSSERAGLLLKHAADYEARLDAAIAEFLTGARQVALTGTSDGIPDLAKLQALLDSYYGHVIRPRVTAASSSCANAMLAMQTLLRYAGKREQLGIGPDSHYDADMATVIDAQIDQCAWFAGPATVGEFTMSGKICKLNASFTLTMFTPDGNLSQKFVPTSKSAGTESYSGVLAETNVQGSGTYTVTGLGEIGTVLNLSDHQCISNVAINSCADAAVPIPLKRLESGC